MEGSQCGIPSQFHSCQIPRKGLSEMEPALCHASISDWSLIGCKSSQFHPEAFYLLSVGNATGNPTKIKYE